MQRSFTFVLLLVVCLVCLGPVAAQDAPSPEPVGLRPDAPQYALHGPYWVGIQDFPITFEYPDGMTRDSRVTIWYPAQAPAADAEPFTYPAEPRALAYAGPLFFPRTGEAYADAVPATEGAPYPLVIYSHGGWSYRWLQTEYAEHLASHGFVVMATDHEDAPPVGAMLPHFELSRQWDVSQLIDYADQISAADGSLAGLIDTDRVGVTGYSAGGFTALLAGGARINPQAKVDWCASAETQASWIGPLLCGNLEERANVWFDLLGWPESNGELWPAIGNPRVDAIVSLDGGAHDFGPEGISALSVPALLFFARGGPDAIPYDHERIVQSPAQESRAIAIFENAGHSLFNQRCLDQMIGPETASFCLPPVWDKAREEDLLNHFTTAFLLATLKGDADAAAALSPDAVSFPGIEYQAEGF
ncbi:MAG: hypothetical protein U0452_04240 [Anaerolineae bacterium]